MRKGNESVFSDHLQERLLLSFKQKQCSSDREDHGIKQFIASVCVVAGLLFGSFGFLWERVRGEKTALNLMNLLKLLARVRFLRRVWKLATRK